MAMLTLFTAPKPFTNTHIAVIQRNAIHSWLDLGNDVEVLLLGEEEGLSAAAKSLGVRHISKIKCNASGTPLISALFETARRESDSPLLAYVNADILLLPNFLSTARKTLETNKRFLLIGQRWDLEITSELDFSTGWQDRLMLNCKTRGSLHKAVGSDYFIFPRECFRKIPGFAIGRAGWDNWMIYESRRQGWKTIDATDEIHIIHQNHDYSHLPGGKPHYHLPETDENICLAGGRRTIFMLSDANWAFNNGDIKRVKLNLNRLLREIEIFPLVSLKSICLGEVFHMILHPKKAYGAIRALFGLNKRRQE